MAKSKKNSSKGMVHHEMPVPDFLQAYGKTMASQNKAITDYFSRRAADNLQTMMKITVCASPLEAATAMTEYWQRVGKDNTELMSVIMKTPGEVEQEVRELIESETKILAEGGEEVFENSPV